MSSFVLFSVKTDNSITLSTFYVKGCINRKLSSLSVENLNPSKVKGPLG